MRLKNISLIIFFVLFYCNIVTPVDWAMWRYDAARSAVSPEKLEKELSLQWVHHFSKREPLWDDPLNQDLMQFDRIFEPIILDKTLYIGFNDCDKVAAYDLDTGKHKWDFFVDGPVRLPLTAWKDKIYFTADDGYLYCLSAADGTLLWKFKGGPDEQKVLGNKRLISMWPARGGVVVKDGILYFAASIWPMMGTFLYSLDAESGQVIWRNEETSAHFIKQPHNNPAFAGVAPQGTFVISGDKLLVPGGRSVPACFNRFTGDTLYYHMAKYGKTGGAFICATDNVFFNHDRDRKTNLYDLQTGEMIKKELGNYPVVSKDIYYFSGSSIHARTSLNPADILWKTEVDASGDLILAGGILYAGGENSITALEASTDSLIPSIIWKKEIEGKVGRLIAGNGYLVAVTEDGRIMAYGNKKIDVRMYYKQVQEWEPPNRAAVQAHKILNETHTDQGYALFYNIGDGDLLGALTKYSKLFMIGVEPDQDKINQLRVRYEKMGWYGKRISLIPGTPESVKFPQYFSSLTILGESDSNRIQVGEEQINQLIWTARPYDGKIWLSFPKKQNTHLDSFILNYNNPDLIKEIFEGSMVFTRKGPLPGSDEWTHQYGNIQNSVKSDDQLVKMPLGILWFGGNSNLDVLPRHGHGPPEQVVDGRLVIEGVEGISARDVYTGRVLWKKPLDSLETFAMYYNETYQNTPLESSYNQRHIPGANGRGTNFVLTKDFVYVIQGTGCQVLEARTGKLVKIIKLPVDSAGRSPEWGYIGVYNNYLIAGSEFVQYSDLVPLTAEEKEEISQLSLTKFSDLRDKTNYDLTASKKLIVMDRYSGEVLWQTKSRHGFIHNSIIVGDNKLFYLDKIPAFTESKLERRGIEVPKNFRLLALNIINGQIIWETQNKIFGSWLGYSEENDLILQATRPSRDMLSGEEGTRMIVYKGKSGEELWDKSLKYNNHPILHGKQIITDQIALDMYSGTRIQRKNPISFELMPWTYSRSYGCNYNIACENLLSFRTSAAGFFDLKNDGGTGHFGGFKSGCTSNLVAADGVLNAPDYTRTCQCGYQNQTSLALVHMPGVEYWTTSDFQWKGEPVKKVGINFNAPGDRMAENATLWLDFPSVGGSSPDIPIEMENNDPKFIRRHSAFLPECEHLPWVSASAITGLKSLILTLANQKMLNSTYTLRFYFIELEGKKRGERLFNVTVQDKPFLTDFDIVSEAGGVNRDLIKTISGVKVEDKLRIDFTSSILSPESQAILSGIEILSDELVGSVSEKVHSER
jgi:outer membrane protein assembly factor BamB